MLKTHNDLFCLVVDMKSPKGKLEQLIIFNVICPSNDFDENIHHDVMDFINLNI